MTGTLGTSAPETGPAERPGPARVVLGWLAGNLVLGYFAIIPAAAAHNLAFYVRAVRHHDVVAPYGPVGARFAVAEIVVWVAVLLTVSVLRNRRHWRRFRTAVPHLPRRAARTAMIGGIVVLQVVPFLVFMTATVRTFPPLFPGSWS